MLEHTFRHIAGIGEEMERDLWRRGVMRWKDYLEADPLPSAGIAGTEYVVRELEGSVRALSEGEHQFFARRLKTAEAWRAFPEFRDSCCYLDIETDGGKQGSSITLIGMYDGVEATILTKGEDLENFRDRITHYRMIVTFFGASFDVPMLQKRFPDVVFDHIHLDLCPTLRRVGLKGGLKSIEKQLGVARGDDTDGLTGWDAVKLWDRWTRFHDTRSLEKLKAYNREDIVNLEPLAEEAYRRLREVTFEAPLRQFSQPD